MFWFNKNIFTSKIKLKGEQDVRDYRAENVLATPDFSNLPEEKLLGSLIEETLYQWSVPACSAIWKTHVSLMQNIVDHDSNKIRLSLKDLWLKMWHTRTAGGEWDYLETALNTEKKQGIIGTDKNGKEYLFTIEWFAYQSFNLRDKEECINTIKWFISQNKPIYTFMEWSTTTRTEMSNGRVKTVLAEKNRTWGHAFALSGYDKNDLVFTNSWRKNNGKLSEFRISYSDYREIIKAGMCGWRYRITYDKEDNPVESLFIDYAPAEWTEKYKAVKRAKENGIINGVDKWDWNFALEPDRALTREEMLLILYRYNNK